MTLTSISRRRRRLKVVGGRATVCFNRNRNSVTKNNKKNKPNQTKPNQTKHQHARKNAQVARRVNKEQQRPGPAPRPGPPPPVDPPPFHHRGPPNQDGARCDDTTRSTDDPRTKKKHGKRNDSILRFSASFCVVFVCLLFGLFVLIFFTLWVMTPCFRLLSGRHFVRRPCACQLLSRSGDNFIVCCFFF